jgi:[ribosomal protein S5]-alanine N-acetyltransferase
MTVTLKTKRLTLRPLRLSDQKAMVDAIMSDMDVMEWLPYSDAVATPEGQKEVALSYINDFIKHWDLHGFGVWAVCIKDTKLGGLGKFIGYCGFLLEQIEEAGPEIAYAIKKSMWGKGLVTEALNACLNWIFKKSEINRVHAVTDNGNIASNRIMQKVGMMYEKDVDLYDSVANGYGLLPYYSIEREVFLTIKKKGLKEEP